MEKKLLLVIILLCFYTAQAQIGIGTPTPHPSAILDLTSTTKGFLPPSLTTAQRDAIASPVKGLLINNVTKNCIEWYNGTIWYNGCGIDDSSNGTAIISGYSSMTANGTMSIGTPVTNVTETAIVNVTVLGTYSISAVGNGVTFKSYGVFTTLGSQNIIFTSTGTPNNGGDYNFILDVTGGYNFNRTALANLSSNGGASISSFDCSSASDAVQVSKSFSNYTRIIVANVQNSGTYNIQIPTVNGISFAGTGTFITTGIQNITLTASGIPIAIGTNNFALNTTPSCNFNISAIPNESSNGTAVVSSYTSIPSTEKMAAGVSTNGIITQTITANVTTAGTYDIATASVNGVIFSGTGTLTTGTSTITLTAAGSPISIGNHTFTINTNPNCSFSRKTQNLGDAICDGSEQTTVVNITSSTGKIWMDRNLGAYRAATSSTDYGAFGCLYQWGRGNDGHASINWTSSSSGTPVNGSTSILSASSTPNNALFITNSNTASFYDWITPQNHNLGTLTNICPSGYRLPTLAELNAEITSYSITNTATAYSNGPNGGFKFTRPGYRKYDTGLLTLSGNSPAYYWTSTVIDPNDASPTPSPTPYAFYRFLSPSSTSTTFFYRANGYSVRCIKS